MMVLMMIKGGAEQEWRMRFRRYKEEVFFSFFLVPTMFMPCILFYFLHHLGPHSCPFRSTLEKLEILIIILIYRRTRIEVARE
jgi:hypothetical protein